MVIAAAGALAWKMLFFYLLAPIAVRCRPVRVEAPRTADDPGPVLEHASAVSLKLTIGPQRELLVKNEYLQDSPHGIQARTRWLLNWRYPFTSLASRMIGLTRLAADWPAAVTVSPSLIPFEELASIELAADGGFVLQPRHLVGLLQDPSNPISIRSVWRLGSLHSWLTWQFRYLVFHGPGTVIVKGCRGVRIECPDAQRRISADATVGFSASLAYANARTETFIPYLLGLKPLFTDRFSGNGVYAYQEVPAGAQRAGVVERTIMEAFDGVLRAFGV